MEIGAYAWIDHKMNKSQMSVKFIRIYILNRHAWGFSEFHYLTIIFFKKNNKISSKEK